MKQWGVTILFPRGERDLLPERYRSFSDADKVAININKCDERLQARAEEIKEECRETHSLRPSGTSL